MEPTPAVDAATGLPGPHSAPGPAGASGRRSLLIATVVPAIALVVAAASLDAFGKGRRLTGPGRTLGDRALMRLTVDRPDQAYLVWRERGQRGRVAVSLSSRLNFVAQAEDRAGALASGRPVDPAETWERALRPENFLLVAMERGVVRELRHVVPERVFAEKSAQATGLEGVRVTASAISAPHFGSPRTITTLGALGGADRWSEPVLLFVNASFFRGHTPRETLDRLRASGITTDLAVLCRSLDDPEVTEAERGRLADFGALLEAAAP